MAVAKKKKLSFKDKVRDALMTQKKLSKLTGIHQVRLSTVLNSDTEDFEQAEKERIISILNITA